MQMRVATFLDMYLSYLNIFNDRNAQEIKLTRNQYILNVEIRFGLLCENYPHEEKKEEIWLSPVTKTPSPIE